MAGARASLYARSMLGVPGAASAPAAFTVLQFNVLADAYSGAGPRAAREKAFVAAPRDALPWAARRSPLLAEIARASPDIMCLQEVDKFQEWFRPQLAAQGYCGVLHQSDGRHSVCGVALFWRTSRFRLSGSRGVRFLRLGDAHGQVAVMALLESVVDPTRAVLAVVTHLKATKTAAGEEVRLAQTTRLLSAVAEFSTVCSETPHAVVFCADLNATPVEETYPPLAYPAVLHHPLGLRSAYMAGAGTEPPYTTWKIRSNGETRHTIDYIFYSAAHITPTCLYSIPPEGAVGPERLPSWRYPSDHFALAAGFVWRDEPSALAPAACAELPTDAASILQQLVRCVRCTLLACSCRLPR